MEYLVSKDTVPSELFLGVELNVFAGELDAGC